MVLPSSRRRPEIPLSRRAARLALCLLLPALAFAARAPAAAVGQDARVAGDPQARAEPLSRRVQSVKTDIVETTGIGKNGLHLILGGLFFVAASLALARFTPHWPWWSGGVTLLLALLLELVDWSDASLVGKRLTWRHTLEDVLLTCSVAALYLVLRPLYSRLRG